MTRLYVPVLCEKCGEQRGVDGGTYYGRQLGDKPIVQGLCLFCEFVMIETMKKKEEATMNDRTPETATSIMIPHAETVKKALQEYINELQYRVETRSENTDQAVDELKKVEKAYAAISRSSGEERVKELFDAVAHSPSNRLAVALTACYLGYSIPGSEEILRKAGFLEKSADGAAK